MASRASRVVRDSAMLGRQLGCQRPGGVRERVGLWVGPRTMVDHKIGQEGAILVAANGRVLVRLPRQKWVHGEEAQPAQPPRDHVYMVVGARGCGEELAGATLRKGVGMRAKGAKGDVDGDAVIG